MVDGILCEVLHKRGGVYKIKIAGKTTSSYLVTNGTDWAHGDTLKKAKEDLHFKVIAKKLKKDPIKKDTLLTVMYYRTLTGACDSGCRNWMQQNNIPFKIVGDSTVEVKPITAAELLPILEKSKPFGYEQFKKLLTF